MTARTDIAALRRSARAALTGDEAAFEADLLIAHALNRSTSWLFAHGDEIPDVQQQVEISKLIDARTAGVPVAQITGMRGFWTFDVAVDAHTLIPRPETELLVELALTRLPSDGRATLIDLGTGSGAIALALASERPLAQVLAVDASESALAVAKANAARLGLPNIEFRVSDWFSELDPIRVELVVSNPPYLAAGDPHLLTGDLRFEPHSALISGVDGLDAIRHIAAAAPKYLLPEGWLLLEHGLTQGAAVRALLIAAGFTDVATEVDLEQRDRVTLGRLAG